MIIAELRVLQEVRRVISRQWLTWRSTHLCNRRKYTFQFLTNDLELYTYIIDCIMVGSEIRMRCLAFLYSFNTVLLLPAVSTAPRTVRATIGDRAFLVAAASVWNSLSETARASPSLPVFRRRLKTVLPHERPIALTTTWPHHYCWTHCSPRTYVTLK